MLKPQLLRELLLPPSTHPQQKGWLSAASGLIYTKQQTYVVADDEHFLGSFAFDPQKPHSNSAALHLLQLLPGELPQAPKQLKKAKPDLESLLLLPATTEQPHGALLTLGSGGKANRRRGVLLPLTTNGVRYEQITQHDLSDFYEPLSKHFDDLNIEGAFIVSDTLNLLQRGNKGDNAKSACLHFNADHFMAWLVGQRKSAPALQNLVTLDFGSIDGVPLCPTDATALPDGGWIATLVAENTDDSYSDGQCVASAIAVMDADGQLSALHRLHGSPKVEGVALLPATAASKSLVLIMVTDADDPTKPSQLLKVSVGD
jgi:hypothetical protein